MKKIGITTLTIILAVGMIGFTGLDDSKATDAKVNRIDVTTLNSGDTILPGTTLYYNKTSSYISLVQIYENDPIYYSDQKYSNADTLSEITVAANPYLPTGTWIVDGINVNTSSLHYDCDEEYEILLIPGTAQNLMEAQPVSPVVLKGTDATLKMPAYSTTRDFTWFRMDSSKKNLTPGGNSYNSSISQESDGSILINNLRNYGASCELDTITLKNTTLVEFDIEVSNFTGEAGLSLCNKDDSNASYLMAFRDTTVRGILPAGEYQIYADLSYETHDTDSFIKISPLRITEYSAIGSGATVSIPASDTANYKTTNQFVCQADNWQFTNPISFSFRDAQKVTKITTPKTTISLKNRKSYTIPVKAYASGISKPNLVWKSSNPKIATVNQKGKVTAKKTGKVTITATAENGKKIKVTVRVVKKNIKAKKISVSGHKKTIKKGKVAYLKVKTNPVNATANKVTFKSSKKKVLTVDKYGKITAKKKGTAKVTVKAGGKKKVITIKVK